MEEIKEIILSHCKGIAYPEFELEDLNVMVKEINDHYTNVKSQELTKAKEEVEMLKQYAVHSDWCKEIYRRNQEKEWLPNTCSCGLGELLKEVK